MKGKYPSHSSISITFPMTKISQQKYTLGITFSAFGLMEVLTVAGIQ
jgi:hypothetical protein